MGEVFVPLTPRVGARVEVLREEVLHPAFASACMEALEHHGVLVFPRIGLSDEEQVAFSENLGDVIPMGPERPDGTRGAILKITLDPRENPSSAEYLKSTTGWHIDGLTEAGPPPKATVLTARHLPATGGQTEFCSTYAAYEDLPREERTHCEALRAVHSVAASQRYREPDASPKDEARWRRRRDDSEHPLVWRHRSGRKSLVLGITVDHVIGLPESEGRALIERLTAHATRPENVYRHEWQLGDLIIWDNCGVMHRVIPYGEDSGRLMHRTTLYGVEKIDGVEGTAD